MDGFLALLSENPLLRGVQMTLLGGAALLVFLVFFATRDILRRTQSLLYQLSCILLVAALPGIGFLLYLLLRPATTLQEREVLQTLRALQTKMQELEASMQKGQSAQQMPYRPLIASLRGFSARMKKQNNAEKPASVLASSLI